MDGCVGCRLIIATTATLSHDVNDVKITQSENPRENRTAAASAAARSRGEKRRRKGNGEMMIGDGGRDGGRGPIFFPPESINESCRSREAAEAVCVNHEAAIMK